jgi:hypothetical protein
MGNRGLSACEETVAPTLYPLFPNSLELKPALA